MYFLESVRDPEMRDVIDMGVRVIRPGQSQPLPRPSDKLRVAACFRTEENDIVLSTCTLGVLSMDDAAPSSGSSSTRDLSLGQPSSSQQSNPFSRVSTLLHSPTFNLINHFFHREDQGFGPTHSLETHVLIFRRPFPKEATS